jgi:hypothetical protein
MATVNVVYIPGVLGSGLSWFPGGGAPPQPIWLDLPAVAEGQFSYLELAPDNKSPGPLAQGRVIGPDGTLFPSYYPLLRWMQNDGWNVFTVCQDWRWSLFDLAPLWWGQIKAFLGVQPFYMVCHSLGGLLGRMIFGQMQAAGQDGQLLGMVTLGTPHYGSFESVRAFMRLNFIYTGLVSVCGFTSALLGTPGPMYVDRVLASHPVWYELMPSAVAGPLFTDAPDQVKELYTPGFLSGINSYVQDSKLLNAELLQGQLNGLIPSKRLASIVGTTWPTPYQFAATGKPNQEDGYLYTDEGDGSVTVAQSTVPGAPVYRTTALHPLLTQFPPVWQFIQQLIPGGFPTP